MPDWVVWERDPFDPAGRKPRVSKIIRTKFAGYLADGTSIGEFDDIYECAVVGLSVVERELAPPAEEDGAFELRYDNRGDGGPAASTSKLKIDWASIALVRSKRLP